MPWLRAPHDMPVQWGGPAGNLNFLAAALRRRPPCSAARAVWRVALGNNVMLGQGGYSPGNACFCLPCLGTVCGLLPHHAAALQRQRLCFTFWADLILAAVQPGAYSLPPCNMGAAWAARRPSQRAIWR